MRASLRCPHFSLKSGPVLCGSSLRNEGIQPFLDAVIYFLSSPQDVGMLVGRDLEFSDITTEAVFDRDKDRYLLVNAGWDQGIRIHGSLVHIDIINGKFWVQRDGTEDQRAHRFCGSLR